MSMSPDELEFLRLGPVVINATLLGTWVVIVLMTVGSWMVTRRHSATTRVSRWSHVLEVVVLGMQRQIREDSRQEPGAYLPFVGTIFLFTAAATLLSLVPGFVPPTASLATTAALAACVFVAVPLFGIQQMDVARHVLRELADDDLEHPASCSERPSPCHCRPA